MEWTIFWAIFSFLTGLLVGHWLALGRDKRQEFNEVAMPIREALHIELEDRRPVWLKASQVDWERIEAGLWPWQRPGLRLALAERKAAASKFIQVGNGDVIFPAPDLLHSANAKLLGYTRLK